MQAISLWLAAAIVILTGWAIVKKYQVNMVLFIAGLLLNIIGVMNGATNFLPKNATATGLLGFDFFELFRAICRTQIAGVGFIILVSGGFAQYMKDVGASDRFVTVCAKPITLLKNPYLILGLVFIIGHCLGLVITSAAGLAMLLIVTVYPLIIRVGCSSLSAAAVVASVLCVGYAPASGVTGTGVVLSAIIGVVTVLTGSGVAAFTSLAHVIPDVAQHLNSNGIAIMLMMHTASEMLRALSPVAGVIIIVAGFAKVSPFAIIKRTAIPCVVGYITMLIIVSAIF